MATQLIMTVGTNALPIWVAWQHLKDKIDGKVELRFIHTEQSETEKKLLEERIKAGSPTTKIHTAVLIDPGDLQGIHNAIETDVVNTRGDYKHFHIHYTGGTKSMGVETTAIIKQKLSGVPNSNVNTSYLNPRGSHGSEIVSHQTHLHVPDTREGINIDLESIAELNGVQFKDPPGQPTQDQINRGIGWLDNNWPHAPAYRDGDTKDGFILEYGVYAAFHSALTTRNRDHWQLYRGLHAQRVPHFGRRRNPYPFELDVVAVLGYQVVIVSCTLDNDAGNIKLKAMEGIIRARQLGGDEAQCITVCIAKNDSCANIQSGLEDEMGSDTPHIRVWGKSNAGRLPNLEGLTNKFRNYLNDLSW